LGLWNGSFYAVFLTDAWFDGSGTLFPDNGTGFLYVTGKVTHPPGNWTVQTAPFPGDYINAYYTVSLALDSNHNPGIAFNVANDIYEGIAFWRPGTTTSTLVAHNDGYTTNDNPAISLAFYGTVPEGVTDASWDYNSFDPDHEPADLWAMRATNAAGTSWMSAVDVSPDNVYEMDSPWMTTGSKGQTAIAMGLQFGSGGPRHAMWIPEDLPLGRLPDLSDLRSGGRRPCLFLAQQHAPGAALRSQRQALAGIQQQRRSGRHGYRIDAVERAVALTAPPAVARIGTRPA
jgi:hypothetical protein